MLSYSQSSYQSPLFPESRKKIGTIRELMDELELIAKGNVINRIF